MLSPEELMKPRYKVIADYPGNPFKVGQVLTLEEADEIVDFPENLFEPYPHLFSPLPWWAERTEKDIEAIEYLKVKSTEDVLRTADLVSGVWKNHLVNYTPATESDYQTYLTSKQ